MFRRTCKLGIWCVASAALFWPAWARAELLAAASPQAALPDQTAYASDIPNAWWSLENQLTLPSKGELGPPFLAGKMAVTDKTKAVVDGKPLDGEAAPPKNSAAKKLPAGLAGKKPATGGSMPEGRTIIDIQESQRTETLKISNGDHGIASAQMVNLNPEIGSWYVLRVKWAGDSREYVFHLEITAPGAGMGMDQAAPGQLLILENGAAQSCSFFAKDKKNALLATLKSPEAYTMFCNDKLMTRNKVDGRKTTKEWVSEFLRDNVWGGERLTSMVKENFFKDKFVIAGEVDSAAKGQGMARQDSKAPDAAKIAPASKDLALVPTGLGLSAATESGGKMTVGRWYEMKTVDGVYVSAIEPDFIDSEILNSYKSLANRFDNVEAKAIAYLVAFDLKDYDINFAVGTDHPRVDWSPRVLPDAKVEEMPGPDGIGNWAPLVTTGMVPPRLTNRVVATFTGGFKRDHAALKWGPLAYKNRGSHYGVLENGVVFSRLNPGLSTIYRGKNGDVEMKTWEDQDAQTVGSLTFARQNGVPIVEWDSAAQRAMPGKLVRQWGPGNWSGSEDSKLRSLRAGVCLQQNQGKKFLIYGYFSGATPSVMARVFQAYGCRYAMHLDMNALEHTYLAIYARDANNMSIEHLITGMSVLDKKVKNRDIPRFLGFSDNRDFFYIYKRTP